MVEQIAFSPDGSKLATSERDLVSGAPQYDGYTIHLWDAVTGKQLAEFEGRRAKPGTRAPQARQGKTPPVAMGFGGLGPAAQAEYEAFSAAFPGKPQLRFSPNGSQLALLDASAGHLIDATLDLWNLAEVVSPGNAPAAASSADAKPSSAEAKQSSGGQGGKEKLRLWTSADGQFTVEAELAADAGDKITLKKASGGNRRCPSRPA